MYFEYGEPELEYLRKKDKKLAEVINKVGIFIGKRTPIFFPQLFIISSVSRYRRKRRQRYGSVCRTNSARSMRRKFYPPGYRSFSHSE